MRNASSAPTGRRLLSQTAEHALRAALYLGSRAHQELVSARDVAAALGTPANYTAKTLRQMTRRGLLRSLRGPHGGFALRVAPSELTVARILDAVDGPSARPGVCLLGDRLCSAGAPCAAHRRWMEVQHRANEVLERTTIADFLNGASR